MSFLPMRLASPARRLFLFSSLLFTGSLLSFAVEAATIGPPMLDISKQCEGASGRNVTAMSECIVAESIARSDLLRKWDKLADADVTICLKANRKAKHRPYVALARCLSTATIDNPGAMAMKPEESKQGAIPASHTRP